MTHIDPIERDLVVRAVDGDLVALSQVLVRNFDRIVNYVTPRLPLEERNYGTAEDVTQEAMRVAARDIRRFKPLDGGDGGFFPWLAKIAEHRMQDVIKARNAAKRGGGRAAVHMPSSDDTRTRDLFTYPSPDRTPSKVAARLEAIQALQRLMNELEPDVRAVLHERYIEHKPVAAIAKSRGTTVGAVYSLCQRAIERLREHMGDPAAFLSWKGT